MGCFCVAACVFAAPATAQVDPYGTNDAGGFRNVLPPGSDGVNNAAELVQFTLTGDLPEHFGDQQPLYDGLIRGSLGLTNSELPSFFKDATFGVRDGQVESTITPRPGVTITRDSQYGVPHVYGTTREDTMFGAGYANAADRLFLMDILRHTGRAELSSFVGGSPSNRAMDRSQWQFAPYTDAELQAQFDAAPEMYGKEGVRLQNDVLAYIDGINAYIADALGDPSLMPAEYAALGKAPTMWDVTDVIAEASLIGGIFGKGGGREVDSAETLQALVRRFGRRAGRRAWLDFRAKNDPEAPTTILRRRFPYQTASAFSRRGLARPDPGSVRDAPVAPDVNSRRVNSASAEHAGIASFGAEFLQSLEGPGHASNWLMVNAANSRTGHPIGVLGPQVGYYEPQVLMEMDIHGPGIDARGATFPGVGLYVLLGHGRDYAWSATTANSDNVDTFAEVLCKDAFHYRYRGKCRAMEKLERTNSWTPNGVDDTPPGSETLTAYRTVHGIVYARGKVKGKRVAFVTARTTYGHEADSAMFFSRMNNPTFMRKGVRSFRRAAKKMNFAFNWAYIDSRHTAYQLTGWYPQRARGTSPDFPVLGTGRFDWRNFNPQTHLASFVPQRRIPHAVDPPYLISWNNKQAPGWAAADDIYSYGPIQRQQMLADRVRRGLRGKRKMSLVQLVQAMEGPATQDLRGYRILPLLLRVVGKPQGKLGKAVRTLRRWHNRGAHRRDLNEDGTYENERAVVLMDAWWPLAVEAQFKPVLRERAFEAVGSMVAVGDHTRRSPDAPAFFDGWWGYVHKDLRSVLGGNPPVWRRTYCGRGSLARCRRALRRSLARALKVTKSELYAHGDCDSDPDPQCWDRNRATVASGVSIGDYPFQNRPTFQQTVSIRRSVP